MYLKTKASSCQAHHNLQLVKVMAVSHLPIEGIHTAATDTACLTDPHKGQSGLTAKAQEYAGALRSRAYRLPDVSPGHINFGFRG